MNNYKVEERPLLLWLELSKKGCFFICLDQMLFAHKQSSLDDNDVKNSYTSSLLK